MELSLKLFNTKMIGLTWSFQVSPNSCTNPAYYEEYIKFNAIGDYQKGVGVTHTLVDIENERIAGFVTLRATSLVSIGRDYVKMVD